MKALIAGIALIVFLSACLVYLYGLQTGCLPLITLRVMIWSCVGFGAFICCVFAKYDGSLLSLFLNTFLSGIFALSLVAVLINSLILRSNPYYAISIFFCGTALATFFIVISGRRHGYFKDKYENE